MLHWLLAGGGEKTEGGKELYYPEDILLTDRSRMLVHYYDQTWLKQFIPTTVYVVGEKPPAMWRTFLTNTQFRYVEVFGLKRPPRPEDLTGLVVYTDCPRVGTFESSEPTFNMFHDMSVNAALMNQHGIVTDCWDRERNAWNGEWPKSQFMRYVFDIDALLRNHTLENARMVKRIGRCGQMTNHEHEDIVWPGSFVYLPQVAYQLGGDVRVIEESFDAMVAHLRYYRKTLNPKGLVDESSGSSIYGDWLSYQYNHFNEWLQTQSDSVKESWVNKGWPQFKAPLSERYFLANAVLCDMAGICAAWAAELGRSEERAELQLLHDNLRVAIQNTYFNAVDGTYGRQPDLMPVGEDTLDGWALFVGIPPVEMRRPLMQRMIRRLRGRGHFMTTGVITSLAYFRTLVDYGYTDDIYTLMIREDWPSLGGFMRRGDPSVICEAFYTTKRCDAGRDSLCHADFGQLADWFWYGLGGLRANEAHARPGLKHFTLAPQIPAKMAWVKITHESPYGSIVSSWKNAGGKAVWEVTVPPNSTATALIPTAHAEDIREAGKTLAEAGLIAEHGPNNTTQCELPAGSYRFEFHVTTSPPDSGETKNDQR